MKANGELAIVEKFIPSTGRWAVRLCAGSQQQVTVLASSLRKSIFQ